MKVADWHLKTAVAFFIFNRPDTTTKVFAEIAKVKPPKLLVVADGPRRDHPDDVEKCQAARAIIDRINWDCTLLTQYSEVNLGCRRRLSSGLDWVFSMVEEAIILEDDCLPDPSFFRFCEELLERYRENERIALISGTNLQIVVKHSPYSYTFSCYPLIWGWATWRRFWKHYDVNIKLWPKMRGSGWLETVLGSKGSVYHYWRNVFDGAHQGEIDTWDYQVVFAAWVQQCLAIIPCVNLVSNIGFGSKGGLRNKWHKFADMKTAAITFPLLHPSRISRDTAVDKFIERFSLTPFRPLPVKLMLYFTHRTRRWFLEELHM